MLGSCAPVHLLCPFKDEGTEDGQVDVTDLVSGEELSHFMNNECGKEMKRRRRSG